MLIFAIIIILRVLLFPPTPFLRALQNSKNTPGPDFIFRTRLLMFLESKTQTVTLWNFMSFFDVKSLCWSLYDPCINCNAIAWFVWTVNNDHDTTDTPKSYLKNYFFFEENVRKEVKKNEGKCWNPSIFIALNKS